MDHPFYEELCRRKHPAARWWVWGDVLYYLGLVPAMIWLSLGAAGLVRMLFGMGAEWLIVAAVLFPISLVVFLTGSLVKNHAYVLAERDGIPASAGWPPGQETPQPPSSPPSQ